MSIRGADVELIEVRKPETPECGLVIPNKVRINGQEVALPKDATVVVGEITSDKLVTLTMTMIVRSLSIRGEVDDV